MTAVIGVGTGRCGTNSLTRILDNHPSNLVTHEAFKWKVAWGSPCNEEFEGRLLTADRTRSLFGDVSYAHIPYIVGLAERLPGLKVVCMHRDMDGFIDSFLENITPFFRTNRSAPAARYQPKIKAKTDREACGIFWEMCQETMARIPGAHHMDVADLNSDDALDELGDYLELDSDRHFPAHRRYGIRGFPIHERTELRQRTVDPTWQGRYMESVMKESESA